MSADTLLEPPSASTDAAPRGLAIPAFLARERLRLTRGTALVILAVLFLVSVWLRTRGLRFHYWIDEALSVGIASHPLGHIPALMHQDGSPPLYYMLLHVWIALRGHNEIATHELSLIFALLTIPVAYWAGSSLFDDRRTGVICAVLAAGAPYLTIYGQETRMYALLALLALVVAASFVHTFVMRNRRYLPVFVVSLAAALYTHNWALFLGLMTGAAFLLCVLESAPQHRPALWRDGIIAFGGVAVLYAPWVPTVLYQAKHTGAPWTLPPVVWSLSEGAYSLVGGRGAAVALLLGGGAGLLALRRLELTRAVRGTERSPLLLAAKCLLMLGFGTMVLAWVYAKITPSWAIRYLAAIIGPLILLFGLGLARGGRLAMVALVLTACFWILDPVPTSVDSKSNVATAMAKVRRQLGSNALVLSTQPEQVPTLAFYLPHVSHYGTPLGPVADPRVVDWRDALARFRHASERGTLEAMLASLAPGAPVLLVVPARQQTSPLWFKLINRFTASWSSILSHDHALRRVRMVSPNANKSGLPVQATLYVPRT